MNQKRYLILAAVAIGIIFLCGPGCGKKGMPRPPHTPPPSPVCGFSVEKEDSRARLTWSQTGCRPGGKVEGFNVYVHKERIDKPSCADCPQTFEKSATVHVGRLNPWKTTSDKAVHVESIEQGFRYIFKVVAFGPGGESENSELITIE